MALTNTLEFCCTDEIEQLTPQYYESILDTIGETPLVRLSRVIGSATRGTVLAKVEFFNPGGSIKDRVGYNMIETAERRGLLKPGGTIVEATSGNTGIGLTLTAAKKGYKVVLVMPDRMSPEKVNTLRALGAKVVLAPSNVGPDHPDNSVNMAKRIAEETPNSFWTNQYKNQANPTAHYSSTGPEIWRQTAGRIKVLVCGMGTGGTISGTGRYLKEQNPDIKVVGVDVRGSLIYDSWKAGHEVTEYEKTPFKVEGIGKDFIPDTMNLGIVDEIVRITDGEAFRMTRRVAQEEGIFAGGSSGGATAGLLKSKYVQALQPGEIAVVVYPDSGNRYISRIFNDDWMRENGYLD
ncbi:MAG: cysteine synthase family protein [Anaerolineae bacterium]|nr:cysteine synthase family protein [Anaerolineae bacterium]